MATFVQVPAGKEQVSVNADQVIYVTEYGADKCIIYFVNPGVVTVTADISREQFQMRVWHAKHGDGWP